VIEAVCRRSWADSARRCCRFVGVRPKGRKGERCGDETRCEGQIKYFIGSSKHWRYSCFAALLTSNEVHASNRSHPVIIAHYTRRLRNIDARVSSSDSLENAMIAPPTPQRFTHRRSGIKQTASVGHKTRASKDFVMLRTTDSRSPNSEYL